MTDWTPCIVRVAGLPASTLEAFAGSLGGRIDAVDELEAELSAARSDAVELLFQHVPGASPDERRQLLKWKRKCFNGRPVGGDVAAGLADPFPAAVRETLAGLAGLESKVASARSALRDAYADQLLRERRQLVDAAQDPGIRRGIALASASTAASLHRTANFFGGSLDRRDRKLEQSLTRFVSRAAHKTSPFSALTAVGLGRLVDLESAGNAPRWLPGETRVRALLRLKRYLFHQLAETLCAVPRYRGHLKLVLNNSLESIGPGRARFFRRGFRGPDPETGGTRLNRPSIVRLDMDRGLVEALRERCGGRVFGFDEAESTLRPFVDSADDVAPIADHLLALGCLEPVLPWCNTDVRAETKFLEFLRSLPFDDALGEVIVACEELIELEDGFTDADDPVHAVRDIPRLLAKAWAGVAALAGLRPDAKFVMSPKGDLYEDVGSATSTFGAWQMLED
ncbi:MAG: lantibiotic dehydratase [Acidobacteriota bacterium]